MNIKVNRMCKIALMTSLMIILAQIKIALPSLVPITLQTFGVYLMALVLDLKDSIICILLYLLMGMLGLPVFAGFNGGISSIIGPTGGFLMSFPMMVMIIGYYKKHCILSLLVATVVSYMLGMLWFSFILKTTLLAAFQACVLPFLVGDGLKVLLAYKIGRKIK